MKLPRAKIWFMPPVFGAGWFAGYCVSGFVTHPPLAPADVAAWVQAVGSISAILGAFWIADRQTSKDRENELERRCREIKSALNAVATELGAHRVLINSLVATLTRDVEINKIVARPAPDPIFEVYEATASLLGVLNEISLRRQIIGAYIGMRQFYTTCNHLKNLASDSDELALAISTTKGIIDDGKEAIEFIKGAVEAIDLASNKF